MTRKGRDYRVESYAVCPLPEGAANEKDIIEPEPVGDAIRKALRDSHTAPEALCVGDSHVDGYQQNCTHVCVYSTLGNGSANGNGSGTTHSLPHERGQLRL
ncbi:pilus assembly protein PilM [Thiothrix unzii]|uniref:pilus assembly protein PilM n=1 Tax=Thiothrix unzii TaxID=111769 RepID=UPI001FEAE5FC|nr:pilus assembly protein PilM [Thiothrix unzii]